MINNLPSLTTYDKNFIGSIKAKTYNQLVDEAKSLITTRDLMALKIAKMAVLACTIRHGGVSNTLYTLTDFAKDIGMSYKTLSNWTIIYRMVASKIENHIKSNEDWNKARDISNKLITERTLNRKASGLKKGEKSLFINDCEINEHEILVMFKNIDNSFKQLSACRDNIKRSVWNISNVNKITIHDMNILLDINEQANEFIKIANLLIEKTNKKIGELNEI